MLPSTTVPPSLIPRESSLDSRALLVYLLVYNRALLVYNRALLVYNRALLVYNRALLVYNRALLVYNRALLVCIIEPS